MRTRTTPIAATVAVLGAVFTLIGAFGDGHLDLADIRALGIAVGVSGLVWFFVSRGHHDEEAIYEAGRDAGFNAGYLEGRRCARPVVVDMNAARKNRTVGVPYGDSEHPQVDIRDAEHSR